jgi:thiol-disulfide isomerase/thioredoxin
MIMNRIGVVFGSIALLTGSLMAAGVEVPRPAPKLVYNIPGKPPQDLSQFRGKVVALEFIFTTCPHCKAASKLMSKLQTEYGPKGLQVLDVAVNANADLLVDDFAKEEATTFPVGWVFQPDMVSFMGFDSGRFVVPQLVLIDRKGVIHYQTPPIEDEKWDKLMNEAMIRKHIEELLQSSSAASHGVNPRNAGERNASETAGLR